MPTPPLVSTDSFLVGASVSGLATAQNIPFAAVYGLLAMVLTARMVWSTWNKPGIEDRARPVGVMIVFVSMCILRVVMFAMAAVMGHNQPYKPYNQPAPWGMALAYDVVSTVGWGFFSAGVYAIGYSWSGRIPCIYCMLQFSNEPHWWKFVALHLIPILLTILSVVGTAVRLTSLHLVERGGSGLVDTVLFTRGTFVARASVASAVAFAGCFLIVAPYTAFMRAKQRSRKRNEGIDHTAVAAMVREARFTEETGGSERGVVMLLEVLGLLLLCESIYRLLLVQVTMRPVVSTAWIRGQTALDTLLVLPEWIAILLIMVVDEKKLHYGQVDLLALSHDSFFPEKGSKINLVRSYSTPGRERLGSYSTPDLELVQG